MLGVPVQDAFQTMQSFFGSQVAGQFSQFSRVWWVVLQADAHYRCNPEDFDKVYVPLEDRRECAAVRTDHPALRRLAQDSSTRFNGFPAVRSPAARPPGYSSGQALAAMEDVARETLPGDFSFAWAGQALQEKESGGTSTRRSSSASSSCSCCSPRSSRSGRCRSPWCSRCRSPCSARYCSPGSWAWRTTCTSRSGW